MPSAKLHSWETFPRSPHFCLLNSGLRRMKQMKEQIYCSDSSMRFSWCKISARVVFFLLFCMNYYSALYAFQMNWYYYSYTEAHFIWGTSLSYHSGLLKIHCVKYKHLIFIFKTLPNFILILIPALITHLCQLFLCSLSPTKQEKESCPSPSLRRQNSGPTESQCEFCHWFPWGQDFMYI